VTTLLGEELIVCGQLGAEVTSFYRWQGALEREPEVPITLKIRDDRFEACRSRLHELHPYDVPQLLAWPATFVDASYGRWAFGEES